MNNVCVEDCGVMEEKELHDLLMANKPDEAMHDSDACPLCVGQENEAPPKGGDMAEDKTFTQEELDVAIAEAVKPFESKIADLQTSQEEKEIQRRIEEASAELAEQVKDLQSKLDASVIEASQNKESHEELVKWLEEEAAKQVREAEIARLRDERVEVAKKVAPFPDEYLEANADRFAKMSDDDWEAAMADWKALAEAKANKKEEKETEIPSSTAMTGAANGNDDGEEEEVSLLEEVVRGWREEGIDARTVI